MSRGRVGTPGLQRKAREAAADPGSCTAAPQAVQSGGLRVEAAGSVEGGE